MSLPSPGDLSDPEIKFASAALAGRFFTTEPPGEDSKWQIAQSLGGRQWKHTIKGSFTIHEVLWYYLKLAFDILNS